MSLRPARFILACALNGVLASVFSSGVALGQDEQACEAAPPPMISLSYVSRYADDDQNRAKLDEDREAEVEAALSPLDGFIDQLADRTEALYSGNLGDRESAAECILTQLGSWAEADALSDLGTETVRLTVGSRYAAFALILWQTLPYAADHKMRGPIVSWLDSRMQEQMAFWPQAPAGAQQGNLRAWAALAAAAVAMQANDAGLRDWADASATVVICSANPDGSLPQEMGRGKYALHYQLHAIAPLVTAAVLLERQGLLTSRNCDGALHRIVGFATGDLVDGSQSKAITGVDQSLFDGTENLTAYQLAWVEQYLLLRRDATLEAIAASLRPLIYTKLGGNQTMLWGQ